ncbi:hypothetical protein LTR86_003203 [Recurvomyces mirabilis]|nr:hypothetical protein LTR86_003203 [Recurvomyces mirabilis]
MEAGKFVHVPWIIGHNTDEGAGFGAGNINTTQQFLAYLEKNQGLDNATAQDMAILYPDIPSIGIPTTIHGRPGPHIGLQFKRGSAVGGDIATAAPSRLAAQLWAKNNGTVYKHRFDVLVHGLPWWVGAVHFQEVAFVFYNTEGYGYPQNLLPNPMGGPERPNYLALSLLMVRQWVSFINFGDPNMHLGVDAETWPAYTLDGDGPQNFVRAERHVTP